MYEKTPNEMQPIYVPPTELNGAGTGDSVLASMVSRPDGKSVGKIIRVTAKAAPPRQLGGVLQVDPSNNHFIMDPDNQSKK